MATKKKRRKTAKAKAGPRFKLNDQEKRLLGAAAGASLGAIFGLAFAENPEGLIDGIKQIGVTIANTPGLFPGVTFDGVPAAVDDGPAKLWWQRKVTAEWYTDDEGTQHAFALCSKGPPGQSACGEAWLDQPRAPSKGEKRCKACIATLKLSGYTVHSGNIIMGGTGPLEEGPPDPRYPPPSPDTKRTASAPRAKRSSTKRARK
jgi:hypothetical protein